MSPLKRREFLKTVGVATATAALPRALDAGQATAAPPNIVFVLADDMGYGDLSYLNADSQIPTPSIDRIGREGMYFSRRSLTVGAVHPDPVRHPHGPLLLAHPGHVGCALGIQSSPDRARAADRSRVAEAARVSHRVHRQVAPRHGHAHDGRARDAAPSCRGGSSRLHGLDVDWRGTIRNGPLSVGFDHFYGISASLDMHPYIYIEDDRFVGECTTEQDLLFVTRDYRPARYADNTGPSHADFVAEDVLPIITRRSVEYIEGQSPETPFFLCMSLTAPHIPIVPSAPYQGRSELGAYGDFCIEVDDSVGAVLDALDRRGLSENTLVVFTADNGCAPYIGVEEMNEQGHHPSYIYRGYKSDIYEGGHRIPCLASWPQRVVAGTSSNETVCLTDLLATCASILGDPLPADAGEDSYDILPALLGESRSEPIREATVHQAGDGSFSIRQGRWKLEKTASSGGYSRLSEEEVRRRNLPPIQLYDLASDIGETRNVYDEFPEVVERLDALLERYQRQGRSTPL